MESLGNNRYQLLFIDDDASDVCLGQKKLQEAGDQPKPSKTNKISLSDKTKALLLKKTSQAKLGKGEGPFKSNRMKMTNIKMVADQQHQQQQRQQQLREQLHQQQLKIQLQEQQFQREMEQSQMLPPQQQRNYRERPMPSRIINNSKQGGGYGYGYGGGNGGGNGGSGGGRPIKNKYDRHSGSDKTGIKAVVKRNGGGAHNWGSAIKDIEEQNIAMKNATLSNKKDFYNELQHLQQSNYQQQQQLQLQQQQNGENPIEEDDTKYITVEEWRAMRVERAKPIYNIRKAGEGEVTKPDWKKMVVLPRKKSSKADNDGGLEYDASMYPQRVGRLQRIVDIEFKFKDDRRRSGYLSGWGGRPMTKSEAENITDPINMNDEVEFPTLG